VSFNTVFHFSRLSKFYFSPGFAWFAVLFSMQCQKADPVTPPIEEPIAMTMIYPIGGETLSVSSTVRVKWFVII
jgi:hypothetical protein